MAEVVVESGDFVTMTSCDLTSPSLCFNQKNIEENECKKLELLPQKHCNQNQKVKAKGKLMRSAAVCEDSPPEEISPETEISCSDDNEKSLSKSNNQEKSTDPKKGIFSKESSVDSSEPCVEYTDSTGIDLHQFMVDTLNSNPRDRMMLLKLEQDMIDFITSNSPFKKFPHMSSYHRMLVHRVAAYLGMEHNVDQTGKSVIINKTSNTRIPEQRFMDYVHEDKKEEIHRWRIILKRDNSFEDQTQTRLHPLREKQSRSMEEREEEYQKARDRIFNQESACPQESSHTESRAVEEYNPYAETQRRRQLFRGSRDSSGSSWTGSSQQSSFDTDGRYANDPRPWSSTDSSESSFQWTSPASKPQQAANNNWDTRGSITLFKLPPSAQSPPAIIEEPASNSNYILENGIPPGSILVNPHTGQPFLNPDGTPVVYNPPESQQPIRSQAQLQATPPQQQQQQQQVLQYSSVSYTSPQMLQQPFSPIEELSSQFAHVSVSCQSNSEAPPPLYPGQSYIYAAPPPPPPPLTTAPPNYCQPSPQVPIYFYPTSAQPHSCRPGSPGAHLTAGYAPAVGMQQTSTPQNQTVSYTPMAAHHCSMVQGGGVTYPQTKVMDGAYCCIVPQPSHHPHPCPTSINPPPWTAQY